MRRPRFPFVFASVLLFWVFVSEARAQNLTPILIDDLLKIESLAAADNPFNIPLAFSPDGDFLAYSVRRGPLGSKAFVELRGKDHDIWLFSYKTAKAINLTEGLKDGASSFNPVWSPDSQRLAFFSTRGSRDMMKLWIWERATGKLSQVGERAAYSGPSMPNIYWVSNTEVIYFARERAAYGHNMNVPATIADSAKKVRLGGKPTASVLESGGKETVPFERKITVAKDRSVAYPIYSNVVTRATKQLNDVMCEYPYPSPDRSKIACMSRSPNRTTANRLHIITKDGAMALPRNEAFDAVDWYGEMSQPTWTPQGRKVSFVTKDENGDPQFIHTYDVVSLRLTKLPLDRLTFPILKFNSAWAPRKMFKVRWVTEDKLAVYASEDELKLHIAGTYNDEQAAKSADSKARLDWWLVDETGVIKNLTVRMSEAPAWPSLEDERGSMLGVSEGRLWRIPANGGEPVMLFRNLPEKIVSWESDASDAKISSIIATARTEAGEEKHYWLDLASETFKPITRPKDTAAMRTFSQRNRSVIFSGDDRTGSYLWSQRIDPGSKTLVHETNTFLRERAEAETRPIEYKSSDGKLLTGWVVLPLGYLPGQKYPLLTYVHGGRTYTKSRRPSSTNLNNDFQTGNPQYLAAHGYAVLLPSIPLPPIGNTGDPMLEFTKSVLPAVDKVIEMGIADPDRLGVMGCSYGGYTTYGLITQTNRFKAAIAIAGNTDKISDWGTFTPAERYTAFAHEENHRPELSETGQGRMGGPPWTDRERYIRNSPFYYVDRVTTPILILHGDLDSVPIHTAEMFFTGLYRQGKRARFVRYFGEAAHCSCESPANNKHMVKEIFTWLDEHLDVSRDVAGKMVLEGDSIKGSNRTLPLGF